MKLERVNERFQSIQVIPYTMRFRGELEELTVEMHGQSTFKNLSLDLNKAVTLLSAADDMHIFYRMAVLDNKLLGCLYGYVLPTFFSDDLVAKVIGVWVSKKHQGSAAFVRLVTEFEKWAKAKGARLNFLDQTTALDMGRSQKLFEGCGYSICGVNTYKEL